MKRKTVHKWIWVWNFDKEEAWLNEMAAEGWVLTDVGFCKYVFAASEPGEYTVRLEMLDNPPCSGQGKDYISFVEDTGAEYIGNMMKWVYFRKKAEDEAFDLFSDIDSRVKHLTGIIRLVGAIGAANLVIGVHYLNSVGMINLLCAALLGYACWRLNKKKERLLEDRVLHE